MSNAFRPVFWSRALIGLGLVLGMGLGPIAPVLAHTPVAEEAPATVKPPRRNPVLILPGFMMPDFSYELLRGALLRAGYSDITVLGGWPYFSSITEYAAHAKREADLALARTGATHIELVCHSMGGLVGRYMIQNHGYETKVAHYVSFGTPHHGTQIAPLAGWWLACAAEMSPGSPLLMALNAQEGRASTIKYTSVHAAYDEIVWPQTSADLAGADNPELANMFHITGVLMPEMARATIEALER